jgi:rare lipoprotein A
MSICSSSPRIVLLLVLGCLSACTGSAPRFTTSPVMSSGDDGGHLLNGIASYYAHEFHGRTTANGEVFDMHALTAAHRTLPFNTRVRVRNLTNNRVVEVRINDRGPFKDNRVIDLSLEAAKELDMIQDGTTPVEIEILA